MLRFLSFVLPVLALGAVALFLNQVAKADSTTSGSVKVTVQDSDNKPVAGADVRITVPRTRGGGGGGTSRPAPVAEGNTGADGTVTLANVPAGDYMAMATKDNARGRSSAKFTVTAGKTVEVTVTIKPPAN